MPKHSTPTTRMTRPAPPAAGGRSRAASAERGHPAPHVRQYTKREILKLQSKVDQLKTQLAVRETDNTFYTGDQFAGDVYRSRTDYDRQSVLNQCLLAWRVNPVARRIVELTRDFVLGGGVAWEVDNDRARKFLKEFWDHPLNQMDQQLIEWCDEVTRSGDLFTLWSVVDGIPYVRGVASEQVADIQTARNDYRQEQFFLRNRLDESPWPAWNTDENEQDLFMQHFPINRAIGNCFGEPDLGPILKWLGRLTTIVEDRAILNHISNLLLLILEGDFKSDKEMKARQLELNLHPPRTGSILVKNKSETWGTLSPQLHAFDAQQDILAVKKMIAAGVGLPLHYLAEPESATRTTADASGTPTFRRFEQRQRFFEHVIRTMLETALAVRRRTDSRIPARVTITVKCGDVTERDNANLALAVNRIYPALLELFDRKLVKEQDVLELIYQMVGSVYDRTAPQGLRRPLAAKSMPAPAEPDPDDEPDDSQDPDDE